MGVPLFILASALDRARGSWHNRTQQHNEHSKKDFVVWTRRERVWRIHQMLRRRS